ncbi:hypothetical protein NQ315_013527 [Exocentrus adspersus]|uniref:Tyr recombinase domain-containing protein n=1 Tax=Exocentrus adspersus TaxID=1586481 RepID=A0AAV8VBI0_9CUCU|nr:hypothetical protein NQ315_013527 [Exocentrus adspersus]
MGQTPCVKHKLKSTARGRISSYRKVNIGEYHRLEAYLKQMSKGYIPKKSKILTREDILKFIKEASSHAYLLEKVILVMGVFGGLKRDELVKLSINDIDDKGSVVIVRINDTKTRVRKCFSIVEENEMHALQLYRQFTISVRSPWGSSKPLYLRDDGNNNLVINTKPTDEEECRIIESISNPQELNEDDAVPILDLEKSISNLNTAIRSNVKTVGDFRAFKKLVASIEPTLQAMQESKTRKTSLSFTTEIPKPGAIPKITPQRKNPLLFLTKNKKTKNRGNRKNVNVTYDSDNKIAINLLQ